MTYGEHTQELARLMAGIVARPEARIPDTDLPTVLDCRDVVTSTVAATYRRLTHANPHYPATLSGLETNPVDVLGGLLARHPRIGSGERSPTERVDQVGTNPMTRRWQHAARAATLAAHRAETAGLVWRSDPEAAWKGVADLAALAQALPAADRDLAHAAEAAGWTEHTHALRAAASSGIATAAPTVEALARSGPLSTRADQAAGPPATLTPTPVRHLADLAEAQHKTAAQLRAATPAPSLHVVTAVATGQARASGAAADMLARDPDNHSVVAALRDRADNLTEIAAARTRIASIHPGRGDVRAAHQAGEVMRVLTARTRDVPKDLDPAAPHLLAFASAGSDVVTALDEAVSGASARGDYVVPSQGLHTAWERAGAGTSPPLLAATHTAATREASINRTVTAAYDQVVATTGAARPAAGRATADLTRALAARQIHTTSQRPASPLSPATSPGRRKERDREH